MTLPRRLATFLLALGFGAFGLLTAPKAAPAETAATAAAAAAAKPADLLAGDFQQHESGLRWRDLRAGDGQVVNVGDVARIEFVGRVADGTEFDSSAAHGGKRPVLIRDGWTVGLAGMKAGGERRLVIPPDLGYGDRGHGDKVPPGATLVYDIVVVDSSPPLGFPALDKLELTTAPSGLRWHDLRVGDDTEVAAGAHVNVHYTGWLLDGTQFDSSRERGQPFHVHGLGQGIVIRGWDEGLVGMRVGGRRILVIPPELGYGAGGAGTTIPPGATLVFDVEMVSIGH